MPEETDPTREVLLTETYHRLRQLAERRLSNERSDHTLQATALVHEAWLRLDKTHQTPRDQMNFIAAMSNIMRRVLVDHARRHLAEKRGGGVVHSSFDDDLSNASEENTRSTELIAVDEALKDLEGQHPRPAALVRLRYFTGLTIDEAAAALEISNATANRDWAFAKEWIGRVIQDGRN